MFLILQCDRCERDGAGAKQGRSLRAEWAPGAQVGEERQRCRVVGSQHAGSKSWSLGLTDPVCCGCSS